MHLPNHQCRGRMLIFSAAKAKIRALEQHERRSPRFTQSHMNYNIPINEDEIVERFVRKNPRRLFRSLYIE